MCCIFLATKIEHKTIPLNDFLAKIPKSPSPIEMVELELQVSSALDFDYMIQTPYWALHGFFLDLQIFIQDQPVSQLEKQSTLQNLLSTYNASLQLVVKSLQTDLVFIYPSSQIALACIWACQTPDLQLNDYIQLRIIDHHKRLGDKDPESDSDDIGTRFVQLLIKLAHEIMIYSPIEKELAKSLVRISIA